MEFLRLKVRFDHWRTPLVGGFLLWIVWQTTQTENPRTNENYEIRDEGINETNFAPFGPNIDYETKWFLQKLDHFNSSNNVTWKQRYAVHKRYYKTNGPIFLHLTLIGSTFHSWMEDGAVERFAKALNALSFGIEHRYYGESRPTKDMSTENLVYLTTDQAQADVAEFIVKISKEYGIPTSAKWVVFGWDYTGALATWTRIKYPHLVYAAVAFDAPPLVNLNAREYHQAVEVAIAAYSPECVAQMQQANQMIIDHLKTTDGKKILTNKFKLCDPLNDNNTQGFEHFFEVLGTHFTEIIQYTNSIYFIGRDDNLVLEALCDIMVNNSNTTSLDRYVTAHNSILSHSEFNCTQYYSHTKKNNSYTNIYWENDENGNRQWLYQSCMELGYFETVYPDEVFDHKFPLDHIFKSCDDVFEKIFSLEKLSASIKRINDLYWASNNTKGTRIIYVQESLVPWHELGMFRPLSEESVLIFLNCSQQCVDVEQPIPKDFAPFNGTRAVVEADLTVWLTENEFDILHQSRNLFIYLSVLIVIVYYFFYIELPR